MREGSNKRSATDGLAGARVALVHDWLTGMRGGEKVLEAIAGLFPGAPIYTLIHLPGKVGGPLEDHPIHTSFLQRIPGIGRHYRTFLPLFPSAIEDFDLGAYDLVISTSHCVAKGIIPGPDAKHLCYCHTPMRYAWDQEHVYFPKRRGPAARLRNLALTALRAWDVASLPRVDGFAANSSFVAQRIARYYARPAEVIPPPVDVERFRQGLNPDDLSPSATTPQGQPRSGDYALMVSALSPYKRVDLAIEACRRRGLDLRVVGSGPEEKQLRRLAGPHVHFEGRVDDDTLRRLYQEARLFVQPGLEDFGIAAVESLASGTPVVAWGRGGVRDIVEDGHHGVLYDVPSDEDALPALDAAIDKSLQIGFNKLELVRRAEAFSRTRFTERIRRAVSKLLDSAHPGHPEIPHS